MERGKGGKGWKAREDRRREGGQRKKKGREDKTVSELDAASFWQWVKIPRLLGPGFLLVKCRQWRCLLGLLGSSCPADIIR